MKALIMALMALSFSANADTTALETLLYNGSGPSESVNLSTEETRTEYRTVTVPSTCYRTEYRYRCHWAPGRCRTVCRNGNCRPVCSPGRRICRNIPTRVPYRCTRQVTESYEVFDYYVNTTVNLNFSGDTQMANEEFTVKAVGKEISLSVEDSKGFLVLKRDGEASSSRSGDTVEQSFTYNIELVSANVIGETLGDGIQNVSLRNGVLYFSLGKSFNTEDFVQNLKIYNSRRLLPDTLLLDKDLKSNEMDISAQGNSKMVAVDLTKLGIDLPSRMRVIMTTSFDPRGAEVLNADSFEMEASANWIFSK